MKHPKPLTLRLGNDGRNFFLETANGEMLPNIVHMELPTEFPHEYGDGFPLVTVSFILQDIIIETKNFDVPTLSREA